MWRWAVAVALVGGTATVQAADPLEILVTGTIEKNCALATADADVDLGRVDRAGWVSFALEVSCNTPFTYEIRSANGALVQASGLRPIGGFEVRVPYRVRFTLPLEDGDLGGLDVVCGSEELGAAFRRCGAGDSGTSIAIRGRATVTLSWPDARSPLLAGVYTDRLIVTFGVKP